MYNVMRDDKRKESNIRERQLPHCYISSSTSKIGLSICRMCCNNNSCSFKKEIFIVFG